MDDKRPYRPIIQVSILILKGFRMLLDGINILIGGGGGY